MSTLVRKEITRESKTSSLDDLGELSAINDNCSEMEGKVGWLRKFNMERELGKQAASALQDIETEKILTQKRITLASIRTIEAKIKAAIVSKEMPAIGSITIHLNHTTTAIDQALTNGCAADITSHMLNRKANYTALDELSSKNIISVEEADVLRGWFEHWTADDCNSSAERMRKGKDLLRGLHECALEGINRCKNQV